MALDSGYKALGSGDNTVSDPEKKEGSIGDLTPELTLEMTDEELIKLKRDWFGFPFASPLCPAAALTFMFFNSFLK